jgi:glycosyltransferase involved in cell wall biosynthesis
MQGLGLTWLYRLAQEPGRLWTRYLRFNSLFLYYSVRDAILGTPRRLLNSGRIPQRPRIAFLGSRGVPARYSGFEVVVENLGSRLAERGYPVTVYNRYPRYDLPSKTYRGMRVVLLPTIATKSLDTIFHTALSALHALLKGYDIIYLCGVGNALIGGFLRLLGFKVIINVDGADFNRAKWGSMGRTWLRTSERWAMKFGHKVIADNSEIVSRYRREYGAAPELLSYGAIVREEKMACGELAKWNLKPRSYILFVSRLTPENRADLLLKAFSRYRGPLRLVICGGADYEKNHFNTLRSLADDRVIFTGPRYGDSYIELSQNAAFYVMPADIEATRLVLLDQLGMGTAILYHDCAATREVLGDAAEPFSAKDPEDSLAEKLTELSENPARCDELRRLALRRAKETFHWDLVVDRYEQLFEELGVPTGAKTR